MPRFRVKAGLHIGPDYTQDPVEVLDRDGVLVGYKYPSARYMAGEVFDSETDIVAKHGASKFELVGPSRVRPKTVQRGGTVTPPTPPAEELGDDLDDLTLRELHALAEAEGVDLAGAKVKADVVKAIRAARSDDAQP